MRCWVARWKMSNALERGDLASRLSRGHAARCPSCQAFGHALGSLHAQLSRGARAAAVPAPVARRARWPLLVVGPTLVAGAAALAIAIGTGGGASDRVADAPPGADTAGEPFGHVRGVVDRLSQLLAHTPLDTELDDLVYDGRRGLDAVLATGSLGPRR